MSSKGMPWVRFFASDWLAGTRGLSAAETGIYITLIANMYERQAPLPEDASRLSRLCGTSSSVFRRAVDMLIGEGKIVRSDGGLWNERVATELSWCSKKSDAARASANSRWNKKDNKNNGGHDAIASRPQCGKDANQSQNHISKDEPNGSLSLGPNDDSEEPTEISASEEIKIEWNRLANELGLPPVRQFNKKRKSLIAARMDDHGRESVADVFERIRGSPHLRGENDRGWRANFDFVFSASGYLKILEGNYQGGKANGHGQRRQQTNGPEKRTFAEWLAPRSEAETSGGSSDGFSGPTIDLTANGRDG